MVDNVIVEEEKTRAKMVEETKSNYKKNTKRSRGHKTYLIDLYITIKFS
jgi:ribosomal protein L21